MTMPSHDAAGFSWLLDNFGQTVPGVRQTVVVSADGLLMTLSTGLDRTTADQLAAIVAGLSSLTRGAARLLQGGQVRQSVVELDGAFLLLMTISDGSVLAVVADPGCDVGIVGYEMALLVSRAETALTPQLVAEMRRRLPQAGVMA